MLAAGNAQDRYGTGHIARALPHRAISRQPRVLGALFSSRGFRVLADGMAPIDIVSMSNDPDDARWLAEFHWSLLVTESSVITSSNPKMIFCLYG